MLKCNGSEHVEIIIVDDCSPNWKPPENVRSFDKILVLEKNSGAAVARNFGISNALGDIIYLMDSDDYILKRDFVEDHTKYHNTDCVWYSSIQSQGFTSNYPNEVSIETYFDYIFFKQPHICQTSSLFFSRKNSFRFDESLPKHQDWDFILFSCLLNGVKVKRGDGCIFFDRSDKQSLSRVPDGKKSIPWFSKLQSINSLEIDIAQIQYHLFSRYPERYVWIKFICMSIRFLILQKTSVKSSAIKLYHRLNYYVSVIASFCCNSKKNY
ncbi:MAG TPA: hypothetical protein DHW71_06925 [Gammaproteobacteria bacterium]|nr:hypothetical protein [Gammaproteobacteria bacterium]